MGNSFIVVRHSYDDHSYIDGKNDTSLTNDGIKIAKTTAEELAKKINSDNIIIRHSSKKRAAETAEIFCDYFLKKGLNSKYVEEPGLTELFQGKFNFDGMLHQEKINFLQSCWDDFELCRLNGNLQHNFGQNKDKNIVLTPGEKHLDWSIRIANGLLNIIDDIDASYQSINIAHRGAIYEIEQLVKLSNDIINFEDVEAYQTRWMKYCQDYNLEFNDLNKAKVKIKKYKELRKNENNN